MSLDQRQGCIGPESAQVDCRAVGDVARAARLSSRTFGHAEIEHLRQSLNQRGGRNRRRDFDVLARNRDDGRSNGLGASNPAAGDDDLVQLVALVRRRGYLRQGRATPAARRHRRKRCAHCAPDQSITTKRSNVIHLPPST